MAEKAKKSFFETKFMSSKIKSQTVSIFPEAALGYLLGPILALMANGVVNGWLVQYWDKVLGLGTWSPIFETILPIVSAIIIIIGNLFVGRLMERKPSLAGKARPLLLIGMPFVAIALLVLFLVPFPEAAKEETIIQGLITNTISTEGGILASVFIAIGYNLYYAIAWPIYYTSHSALVGLSTRDSGKRGLLGTAVMGAQLGAAGISGMAGGLLVDLLKLLPVYKYSDTYIATYNAAHPDAPLPQSGITNNFNDVSGLVKDFDYTIEVSRAQANEKWTILMIVMIAALVVGSLLEYFFTRERITEENVKFERSLEGKEGEENKNVKAKVSMKEQIAVCVKDKYWWFIMIFWFLYQFGGMMKNNGMPFFSQSLTGTNAVSSLINTVGAIPTAVGMALVWPIAIKFTKAKTISFGGILAGLAASAAFSALGFLGNTAAISSIAVASFVVKALGTAPAMYVSMALMANVLDHQEAVYGIRTDGFSMAVYGSIMVAMAGVCNGIIIGLNNIPGVDKAFLNTFVAFGVEGICYVAIAVMFFFLNVENFTRVDNKAIVADHKAQVLAAGGEWVEPEEAKRLEKEENARLVEEARVEQLKVDCAKKNLNFEEENAKYLEQKAAADKAKAEKKAAAEAEKQAKYDALTQEQKDAIEAKKQAKQAKNDAIDAKALEALNKEREKFGRPAVVLE